MPSTPRFSQKRMTCMIARRTARLSKFKSGW